MAGHSRPKDGVATARLRPAIHVLVRHHRKKDVDARHKAGHDDFHLTASFHLRPYRAEDEDATIALWLRTWQLAYPSIDFPAPVAGGAGRWRTDRGPKAP